MRSFVLGLTLLISSTALADPCGMVPPAWIADTDQAVTRTGLQTTYIFHKDGIETMVLRPGFTGSAAEFGMLIPFPSPPALRKVSEDTHTHLAAAVDAPILPVRIERPRPRSRPSARRGMGRSVATKSTADMTAAPPPAPDEVRVLSEEAVGMYEIAVLDAGSSKALEVWMTANDFAFPNGMETTIDEYVDVRWVFVAVKAKVGTTEGTSPKPGMRTVDTTLPKGERFDGFVQAMGFRFETDEAVIPMRLSVFNGDDTHNLVYVLAEEGVRIKGMDGALTQRQVPGLKVMENLVDPLPISVTGGTLTSAERATLTSKRDPTPYNGAAKQVIAADLLAARTQTLSHDFEEEEKGLLSISERLGLRGSGMDRLHHDAVAEEIDAKADEVLHDLESMVLTVLEGDFDGAYIRDHNLELLAYDMPDDKNDRSAWSRAPSLATYRIWR